MTSIAEKADIVVAADNVARTFGTGAAAVVAVHGVTCQVAAGEQLALSGPSGSGKSTLLHLLAGLDRPTVGTVTWPAIGGHTALRPGPVAVVFQGPSLLPPLDVVENVALPLMLQGVPRLEAELRAVGALERLGLLDLARKLPEELSGGQAQRIGVARVLAGQPKLILADEPTGQLDHIAAGQVIDALLATATEHAAALIVNTHDRAVVERFATRWVMRDGALAVAAAKGAHR